MNAKKQEQYDRLVGPVIGKEPYETVFRRVAGTIMDPAATKKDRQAARREWLAFMRTHVWEYLLLCPDKRDDLIEYLEYYIDNRTLRVQTLVDALTILELARCFRS